MDKLKKIGLARRPDGPKHSSALARIAVFTLLHFAAKFAKLRGWVISSFGLASVIGCLSLF